MWGFIIATFALLAVLFYQASGASDYRPSPASAQTQAMARAASEDAAAETARSGTRSHTPAAASGQSIDGLTLASARSEPTAANREDLLAPPDSGLFSRVVMPSGDVVTPQAPVPATPVVSASATDLRAVAGNRVNMRAGPGTGYGVLATLSRGERVIVLDDPGQGWVKLRVQDGNRVGWMAASLLSRTD